MKPITLIIAISALLFRAVGEDAVTITGATVTGATVTEAGIYTARVIERFAVFGVAGGTNEGLDSFKLVQATTNIPARIGIRFGFRYTIHGIHGTPSNAPVILTMVASHPPYKNPETGKTQTRDEYALRSWAGETYTSYSFDNDWELIPGKFTFQVWQRGTGKKLCEQSFMIVPDGKEKDGAFLDYHYNTLNGEKLVCVASCKQAAGVSGLVFDTLRERGIHSVGTSSGGWDDVFVFENRATEARKILLALALQDDSVHVLSK